MSNEVIKQINFLIYDEAQVKAVLKDESIWLSQKGMAELFECSSDNISLHLKTYLRVESWIKIQLPRKSR